MTRSVAKLSRRAPGNNTRFDVEVLVRTISSCLAKIEAVAEHSDFEGRGLLGGAISQLQELQDRLTLGRLQEARYRQSYLESPGGACLLDREGRIINHNQALASTLEGELEAHSLNNLGLQVFVKPEHRQRLTQTLRKTLQDHQEHHVLVQSRRRRRWLEVRVVARWLDGQRNLLCSVEDRSAEMQARERLLESERSLMGVLEQLPHAVQVVQDGAVLMANGSAYELFGGSVESGCCHLLSLTFVREEDREQAQRRLEVCARDRLPAGPFEWRLAHKERKRSVVRVRFLPTVFEGGPAIIILAEDVTTQRALEVSLAQADRLAAMGTLAAGVAHEINNPLTYVLTNFDELSARLKSHQLPDSKELDELLSEAQEGAYRVRDLVRDFRTFVNVDEDISALRLSVPLEAALRVAGHELRNVGEVTSLIDPELTVRGSHGRCFQIFLNLLLNSARALQHQPRRADRRICIHAVQENEDVYVYVEDSGPGVPREQWEEIFEPFRTSKAVGQISGLGLSISRELARRMGGDLFLVTEPPRPESLSGAILGLHLYQADPLPRSTVLPPTAADNTRIQGGRILIVDDEPTVARALARALRRSHEVDTCHSGVEAQELLRQDDSFDLILSDVLMPDGNGIELRAWIEHEKPQLLPRLIFMSGGAFMPEMDKVASAKTTLRKPVSREDVERTLSKLSRRADDAKN